MLQQRQQSGTLLQLPVRPLMLAARTKLTSIASAAVFVIIKGVPATSKLVNPAPATNTPAAEQCYLRHLLPGWSTGTVAGAADLPAARVMPLGVK